MRYIIFCNGSLDCPSLIKKFAVGSFKLICCDGGIRHAKKLNLIPDLIVGDLDSADSADVNYFKEKGVEFKIYPTEKNDTDSAMALNLAIEEKASEVYLFGATGTRLDHTLANVGMLINAEKAGVPAFIVDSNNTVEIILNEKSFKGKKGDNLSLIPISGVARGVTTNGLYYPLENAELDFARTRGISNVFVGEVATVTVKEGILAAIRAVD